MKITIIGAGAIGGVVGAYMARANEEVTFVDVNVDHVRVMKQSGLRIMAQDEDFTVPVRAMTMEEFQGENDTLDVVFLAVKAQHTELAIKQIYNQLQADSVIVSLQNGLCENIISPVVGRERVIGSFVNIFADYIEPGCIEYGGVGSLYIGELDGSSTDRLAAIKHVLTKWGEVRTTDHIWGYLWGKMSYASILIASALVDEKIADVIEPYEHREVLIELASEALAVAAALKITPMGFDDWEPALLYPKEDWNWLKINEQLDEHISRLRTYKKVKTGFWRDLKIRKCKTEVPYYLKPIIEIGEKYGVDTTRTQKLLVLISEIENGTREMSWDNIAELKFPR